MIVVDALVDETKAKWSEILFGEVCGVLREEAARSIHVCSNDITKFLERFIYLGSILFAKRGNFSVLKGGIFQ